MDLELSGKQVLVTGASKGIGLACALAFAAEGASLVLAARNASSLKSAVESVRKAGAQDAIDFAGDLSRSDERERLASTHPKIDILVNNAGAIPGGSILDMDMATWESSWALKVMGYIHLTKLYLTNMKAANSGTIVNIIGVAGSAPRFNYTCGASGNAALIAFTKAVGGRSPDFGVRVFGLSPASTRTDRLIALFKSLAAQRFGDENRWEEMQTDLPFGRAAEAGEIGNVVAMLASPRGSYMSGTVVDVDGGVQFR